MSVRAFLAAGCAALAVGWLALPIEPIAGAASGTIPTTLAATRVNLSVLAEVLHQEALLHVVEIVIRIALLLDVHALGGAIGDDRFGRGGNAGGPMRQRAFKFIWMLAGIGRVRG